MRIEAEDRDLARQLRRALMSYIPEIDAELRARFDHVLGTLVRLVKPRAG